MPDKTIKEPHYGVTNTKSNLRNNYKEDRGAGSNILNRSESLNDDKSSSSFRLSNTEFLERSLKWQEFTMLVNRYHDKETAREILTCAISRGKYDSAEIDENLSFLRKVDRILFGLPLNTSHHIRSILYNGIQNCPYIGW
jgi:hypothetical protein